MRRIFIGILCFMCAVSVCAQTGKDGYHQKGDIVLSAAVNTAIPFLGTDWGEFNVENKTTGVAHDAKPGDPSIGAALQGVYFMSSRLAVGASAGADYFHHDLASGVNYEVETTVWNFLALARVYINPAASYRFYVPLAAGIGHLKTDLEIRPHEKFHYTGFSAHAGLGVEKSLNDCWGLAFEARYNYNSFHKTKTAQNGDVFRLYPRLNYISYSLRADYRF